MNTVLDLVAPTRRLRVPFAVKQHAMFNNKSIEQQNEQFTSSTSWFMVSD